MRTSDFLLIVSGVLSITMAAPAATRYVNLNNPAPLAPYTSWGTAATNIQNAVDAAAAGDEIVVTNGTYASGGRVVYGMMTNRVAINKALTVRSVNGPAVTIIEGRMAPSSTNGDGAIRCVYVGTNAVLSGFTLTNGHTLTTGDSSKGRSGGGAWCEVSGVISNCTLVGNSANRHGGGAYYGTLRNCTVSGNSASYDGGGVSFGELNNCTLSANSADRGGGAYGGTLNNCTLSRNWAVTDGGGVYSGTLNNCSLIGNTANAGAGAYYSTLNNCAVSGNSAGSRGGGTSQSTLRNCTLSGNSAAYHAGGVHSGALSNCTVVGNSATFYGGGAVSATLNNCIVYYNIAHEDANYDPDSKFSYCCTTPLPPGAGNTEAEPLLASMSHLSEQSPCIGRGSRAYSSGVDIDGEQWLDPPCIGADQFVLGQTTGGLALAIEAAYTNVAPGFAVSLTALIQGRIAYSVWDFGDGTVVSNRVYANHAWATPGLYTVRLTGYNDSWPVGVSTTLQVRVVPRETYYVNAGNMAPVYPYTNWAGAAINIQEAIDAGTQAGRLVIVSNGVYRTGGRAVDGKMTNRVVITEGVEVRSVNGPQLTIIEGRAVPGPTNGTGAIRCVYMGAKAVLSGFTLTNGHTRTFGNAYKERSGGGAWCEVSSVITNCTLRGNSASFFGGGAYFGMLAACTLSGNSVSNGGGAAFSILSNCTLSTNSAKEGGGAYYATLKNCALTGNAADTGGGAAGGTLTNCTLSGNLAKGGGGAYYATLKNCALTGNAAGAGGGAAGGTLTNCTLSGNSASYGGGAHYGTLNNCTLSGNSAKKDGGGSYYGWLTNCTLIGNSATSYDSSGGGAYYGTLNNCTLIGNSAAEGGGVSYGALNNCISYYNIAPKSPNCWSSTFNYSCTTPLPPGPGNIDAEPLLASTGHLLEQSPCISRGSSAYSSGLDIDGEQWLDPPCMGADQFVSGQSTGALVLAIESAYTNVTPGFAVSLTALIQGRITANVWDFGDGTVMSNRVYVSHAWATPGLYTVRLTAYNDSWPDGISTTLQIRVDPQKTYYVNAANSTPSYPYTDWAGAATNMQDAIDAGTQVGRLVLVGDGIYKTGGRAVYGTMTNRVVVTEGVEVRSVNGPLLTFIEGQMAPGLTNGDGAIRCAYVGTNAVLSGFTLTNGHTRALGDIYMEQSGGGALCEVSSIITNCALSSNSAYYNAGGVFSGKLIGCTLNGNSAGSYGGGAYYCTLNDCTLSGNSASYGGGASESTLNDCTLSGNSGSYVGGGAYGGTLSNCTLSGNSASDGGGSYHGTHDNCVLSGNSSRFYGGGACDGALKNCVLSGNSASDGGGASGGMLTNCTLSGNSASNYGGGASAGILNNCTLTVNSASSGGGTYGGMLTNCTLSGNSASNYGGGVFAGTLINCTLVGNSASDGGGAYSATLKNCIVYYNIAPKDANYAFPYFSYCCTTPLPPGQGNVEGAPGFLDTNGWSDLRLKTNSPCINAGANRFVSASTDLDGSPRIVSGTVDIGAYEFQAPASIISYGWLQQYGFSIDGLTDFVDSDIDGANNWEEWVAGTNPTNSSSALRMITVLPDASAPNEITVSWTSVTNRTYRLERALILGVAPRFKTVQSYIIGLDSMTTFTDTNATGPGPFFYRVRVEN